jgi:hypothetical protein
MPKTKMVKVPYLPGRWIDFSDLKNICIREADGTFVAGDLHIAEEDVEKLVRKVKDMVKDTVAKRDDR